VDLDTLGALLPNLFLVLLVAGVLVSGWWFHRKRAAAVRAWAAAVGWRVVGTDASLVHRWRGRPFGIGSSRRVSELVVGTFAGRHAATFRYEYTTGSGKNRSTVTHHVVALALPAFLPTVELTPDGLGAKLAKAFGGQDIVFESDAFNRAWRVTASDARYAHAVLHPRLMERLLRADAQGLSLRIEGADVLCWTLGAPRLDDVARRLHVLTAVVEHVPRFVWLDHGHDPEAPSAAPPAAAHPGHPTHPAVAPVPAPGGPHAVPPATTGSAAPSAPAARPPAPPAPGPGGEPWNRSSS
jgi:hypothetical protein